MSIPPRCEVLVVGGGPAGSYAACALSREGFEVVLLEADFFPRYHVGESMLPSLRQYLKFIDLDKTFDEYGFQVKKGATFKLNKSAPATHTHFVTAGGAYTWNVVRSEADNLLFRHAEKSGARVFDGVKVNALSFRSVETGSLVDAYDPCNANRAVTAQWSRKDGTSGQIEFDQLIDASGRFGLMSSRYLKNRHYNQGLKHAANWSYWTGASTYGTGIHEEGYPYFEHLQDRSGWVWFIPLHNGTTSAGVVMRQDIMVARKKATNYASTTEFYLQTVRELCPGINNLLVDAIREDGHVHAASDWSYSCSSYATSNVRIAGDAGCFIDPFFSSGVHIALTSGLSAAATIASVRRGDVDERIAAEWHSSKVREVYTRFYVVVSSAITQIREGDEVNILGDLTENGFEQAFGHFRPVIHGTADVRPEMNQEAMTKMLHFVSLAFQHTGNEEQEAVLDKMRRVQVTGLGLNEDGTTADGLEKLLTTEEMEILGTIRGRDLIRHENILDMGAISIDAVDGLTVNLQRGSLGLVKQGPAAFNGERAAALGLMMGEKAVIRSSVTEVEVGDDASGIGNLVATVAL